MKKLILTVLFLGLCALLLSSCTPEPGAQEPGTGTAQDGFSYAHIDDPPLPGNAVTVGSPEISGDYLYFIGGTTLMRYNTKTGNLTAVCPDPLCDHKTEDCPFWGITRGGGIFHALGERIVMIKTTVGESGFVDRLYCYDISEKKLSLVMEGDVGGSILSELYVGSLRYFISSVYNERTGEYDTRLCRIDFSATRPADTLLTSAEGLIPKYAVPVFTVGGRIWLTDGAVIYSVSADLADIREEGRGAFAGRMVIDGEYIYYANRLAEGLCDTPQPLYSLHRMKLDGTGGQDFGVVAAGDWQLTENYIYYLEYDSIVIGKNGISDYPGSEIALECGRLRRMRHDGSGGEPVYAFSGEEANTRFRESSLVVSGNYAYGKYFSFTDKNGDGIFTDDEAYGLSFSGGDPRNLIRIDLTTGEAWYIYDY